MSRQMKWVLGKMDGVVKCTLVAAMIVGVLSSGPVRAEDITRGAVTGQTDRRPGL